MDTPTRPTNVFVYGTLRFGFGLNHLVRDSRFMGEKIMKGYAMFHLGGFPCVIRTGVEDDTVVGEVYAVDKETLDTLDGVEGFGGTGYAHNHYERVTETLEDGLEVEVYTYLASQLTRRHHCPQIESGDFTEYELDRRAERGYEVEFSYDELREERDSMLVVEADQS